jgi:hypothetical protein
MRGTKWGVIIQGVFLEYFYWHYVVAPRWLLHFFGTLQLVLLRFFSVPFMIRTLFAHWHGDVAAYRAGGIQALAMAFAWNQISRAIGFLIRSVILASWAFVEVVFVVLTAACLVTFLAAPLVGLFCLAWGMALLL